MAAPTFAPQIEIWSFILGHLARRERVALLLVADSTGHAPGKAGFKMAVDAGGLACGTIGGGAIEHDTVDEARVMLDQRRPQPSVTLRVHEPDHPLTSGMICGGCQTVITYPCRARDRSTIKALLESLEAGRPGTFGLSSHGISFNPCGRQRRQFRYRTDPTGWSFTERVPAPDTVYLIGGGHVALALSRVIATLDLRIVVLDQRPEVNTADWNPYAHERRGLPFAEVGSAIPPGPHSYVVIMTPDHCADDLALRQLVRKRFGYLGVLGSARKARSLLDKLRSAGYPPECLERVHTPVGLPIGSHTPAEIAISIAAEIIQVRNRDTDLPPAGVTRPA